MIILPQTILLELFDNGDSVPMDLVSQDKGDAYIAEQLLANVRIFGNRVRGRLEFTDAEKSTSLAGEEVDVVVSVENRVDEFGRVIEFSKARLTARVRIEGGWEDRQVMIVQIDNEIHSRIKGLYETEILSSKSILLVGVGSGGSSIAIDMAKAGVGNFTLVDEDRLDISNLSRHVCGISDLGRFKTKAVKNLILEKNPNARVTTIQKELKWIDLESVQDLVQGVDLVFCCTDNRESRMLINLACVRSGQTAIFGGTFQRAFGGHVLRVKPRESMCYQCLIDLLPDETSDHEVSNAIQAEAISYADRPVAVEPGLASDIAPISNMCVKLGILELLRGSPTSLSTLYDDLSSAWYQWLNRREPGTDYAGLPPLDSGAEESLRILAWYGILNDKNADCPVCGDPAGPFKNKYVPSKEDISFFGDH